MVERKTMRFDLSAFAGYWAAYEKLKNAKGQIHFNLINSDMNPNRKTDATSPEYYVQLTPAGCKKCFNLSGLRLMFGDEAQAWTCSGEPSQKEVLRTGDKNPLFEERNDGFIFVVGRQFDYVELYVVADGRPFVDAYRKAVALGKYDSELNLMRETATRV